MAYRLVSANHEGVILPKRHYIAGSAETVTIRHSWHGQPSAQRAKQAPSNRLDLKAREMARPTRTYKLKVSPQGFDLIVDSHARLVRATRTLLPYGHALYAALHHLNSIDDDRLSHALSEFPRITLGGGRNGTTLFVGAPKALAELADGLVARLSGLSSTEASVGKGDIYLMSLRAMMDADGATLLRAYSRVVAADSVGLAE